MTRPAPSCFTEDNTRAEGFSGAQIYSQMHGGPGTASANAAATAAAGLGRDYAGIEARLKRVGETLGEAWTGASASAAQAAANPINQAMVQMQDALRQADHSISNQVYQFTLNKNQLKDMPASKPDTNFWDDATPWDTDTEDKVNGYNAEEKHNREVYKEFQSASNTNRGELPKEFPGVTTDSLVVEIAETGGHNGEEKTSKNTTNTRTSSTSTSSSTSTPQSTVGTPWTVPTTNGDQTTTSSSDNTNTSNTNTGKPGVDNLTGKPPVGSVIDRPGNTGLPPIGVPVRPNTGGPKGPGGPNGPGGPGGSGRGGPGGPGAGGKFGGPGGGAGGAGGKFGGGGLGGSSAAAGGTAAQQPGGKAGVFGGMGETGQNAARGGAAGAAGRGGAAGMGGMGGQGQKGQGEDDLEHKSADYLITEENTNEIIGDMPMVAPPTIGG
ncbi:hypothetical protein [Lentzea californiensis]|uniref:hypothetical protein n=1 Tax=Lentzea californiensis TaxID=438851 RepID=UPI0021663FE9|nr:hypothetical protein [Lentzea californiensis]MCR3749837.1 PPE family protein [Lentzea californiensis]